MAPIFTALRPVLAEGALAGVRAGTAIVVTFATIGAVSGGLQVAAKGFSKLRRRNKAVSTTEVSETIEAAPAAA